MLSLLGPDGPTGGAVARRGAGIVAAWDRSGAAVGGAGSPSPMGITLRVEHAAIAGLTVHEASLLGLPPAANAVAATATKGMVTEPGFQVTLRQELLKESLAGAPV